MDFSHLTIEKVTEKRGIVRGRLLGNGQYLIQEEIGVGGYGVIYKALDICYRIPVAIKVSKPDHEYYLSLTRVKLGRPDSPSPVSGEDRSERSQKTSCHWHLRVEYIVLQSMDGCKGFPKVYKLSTTTILNETKTYVVMELLGKSLAKLFAERKYRFSVKTLLIIMDQLLDRLEALHSKGIIHGDFTPNNIMTGTNENSELLYLIDFGMSTKFKDLSTGEHLPLLKNGKGCGVSKFMSRNVHRGIQQSRRDDIESLAYVMAYLTNRGKLPWDKTDAEPDKKNKAIAIMKENIKAEKLFSGYPKEFAIFLDQVKSLGYADEPPYKEYKKMFRELGSSLEVKYDIDKLF